MSRWRAFATAPAIFTAEECARIRSLWKPSDVGVVADGEGYRPTVARDSAVTFLPTDDATFHWIYERLQVIFLSVNVACWSFEITGAEPAQVARYGVGGHYTWHLDVGQGRASLRKASLSVQITPPEDYDGGDLEIHCGGDAPTACSRSLGDAVVFPSYALHRITEVKRGERLSLVAWATGEKAFR